MESEAMGRGRPTVMTDAVVQKLEEAFALGCTDAEACVYAGICRRTLGYYCEENPDFLHRKEDLKTTPVLKARKVVVDALAEKDVNTARWLIEKLDGKAKQAVEHTGPDGGALKIEVISFADNSASK